LEPRVGRSVDLLDLARRDDEGGDVHVEVDIDTAGIPIERGRRALSACETDGRLAVLLAMLAPAPRAFDDMGGGHAEQRVSRLEEECRSNFLHAEMSRSTSSADHGSAIFGWNVCTRRQTASSWSSATTDNRRCVSGWLSSSTPRRSENISASTEDDGASVAVGMTAPVTGTRSRQSVDRRPVLAQAVA
jgi:hypothetical protein